MPDPALNKFALAEIGWCKGRSWWWEGRTKVGGSVFVQGKEDWEADQAWERHGISCGNACQIPTLLPGPATLHGLFRFASANSLCLHMNSQQKCVKNAIAKPEEDAIDL